MVILFTGCASKTNNTPAYQTVAEAEKITCFIKIDCGNILKNAGSLNSAKEKFVPSKGIILEKTEVEFKEGDTADDLLKNVCASHCCFDNCSYCREKGIQFEFTYTPGYDSYYLDGIHQLYGGDCGGYSGWLFKVNGQFLMEASSEYKVKNGDFIEWVYTCDGGPDAGMTF